MYLIRADKMKHDWYELGVQKIIVLVNALYIFRNLSCYFLYDILLYSTLVNPGCFSH